jgi:hypothetical protein
MAMVALITIGMTGAVYAETATVEVPFDSHGMSCSYDSLTVEFHCTWQGMNEVGSIEDLQAYKDLLDETIYNEELRKLEAQALAEIEAEKAKLTPNEKTIQKIEEKLAMGIATATESVYMNLLKELNTCKQGMDRQTAPIQEAREFEISEFNQWKVNNVKYDGHLGDIVLAIEECRAQHKLLKVVGDGYVGMPTGDEDYQFSLLVEYEGIQAIEFDKYTSTTRAVDMSAICDSNAFPATHKAQHGCEVLYDGKTVEQIKAENEARFGADGKIHYQSELLGKYHEYLNNNFRYATVEHKAFEEAIAEPIAKEMIEENAFVQNAIRNGE